MRPTELSLDATESLSTPGRLFLNAAPNATAVATAAAPARALSITAADTSLVSDSALEIATRIKAIAGEGQRMIGIAHTDSAGVAGSLTESLAAALANVQLDPVVALFSKAHTTRLENAVVDPVVTLADVVEGREQLPAAIRPTRVPSCYVATLATEALAPRVCSAPAFKRALEQMRQERGWVLISLGALNTSAAVLLATHCDSVIVAATANKTSKRDLLNARNALTAVRIPTLGVVLTTPEGKGK